MTKNSKDLVLGSLTAVIAAAAGAQAAGAADADMAPANDWTGFYAGASIGVMDGDSPIDNDGPYNLSNDPVFGGFVGYNVQLDNNLVVGAEFALQSGVDMDDDNSSSEFYDINYMADAKFKLGLDIGGSALIYGFGGISGGQMTVASSNYDYGIFGVNYGIGAEMLVTEQFSLGAELMGRTIIDPYGDFDDRSNISHIQGALRASFHF